MQRKEQISDDGYPIIVAQPMEGGTYARPHGFQEQQNNPMGVYIPTPSHQANERALGQPVLVIRQGIQEVGNLYILPTLSLDF